MAKKEGPQPGIRDTAEGVMQHPTSPSELVKRADANDPFGELPLPKPNNPERAEQLKKLGYPTSK